MKNEVTLQVPMALQSLIKANNALLKTYQAKLMQEVQEANDQLMDILQLNSSAGWVLDMERMVYVRPSENPPAEQEKLADASITG